MKNIGGSIFSSSCPSILQPIPFKGGMLQVTPNYEDDTHHLVFLENDSKHILASHPNGFSCHVLATTLVSNDFDEVKEQSDYIIRCGGESNLELLFCLVEQRIS